MESFDSTSKTLSELKAPRRLGFFNIPYSCSQTKSYFSDPMRQFSILSYNVLADSYSSTTQFQRGCSGSFLNFSYRSEIILEELKLLSSDIICLQEIDCSRSAFYQEKLEALGYKTIFAERRSDIKTDSAEKKSDFKIILARGGDIESILEDIVDRIMFSERRNDILDGLIFGVKKSAFEIIEHNILRFDDEEHKYKDVADYKKGNIAIIAALKHKLSGEVVNVISTHLHWDPQADHIKYLQMSQILTYVSKRYSKHDTLIWAGDLNSKPVSNLLNYVLYSAPPEKANLETKDQKVLDVEMEIYQDLQTIRKIEWGNAYQLYGAASGNLSQNYPAYTTYTYRFKETIDHILYSKENLVPKSLLRIPSTSLKQIKTKTLPSKRYPSDHLPIMVKFEIMPNNKYKFVL